MERPLYELQALRSSPRPHFTLEIDQLTLRQGRIYTLTGSNGSGKTTLLSLLGFLARPSSGVMRFGGEPVNWNRRTLSSLRQGVTLLHQSPYLFEGTVAQNVALGLKARAFASREIASRVDEVLERLELASHRDRIAKSLSGGEAQRVAFARALALRPRALLLDEPLSNLDTQSAGILRGVIAGLPAAGQTVVISTHHPLSLNDGPTMEITLHRGRLSTPKNSES